MFSKVKIVTVALVIAYALANVSNVQATNPQVENGCNQIKQRCHSCQAQLNSMTMSNGTQSIGEVYINIKLFLAEIIKIYISIKGIIGTDDCNMISVTLKLIITVILQIIAVVQGIVQIGSSTDAMMGCLTSVSTNLDLVIQLTLALSGKITISVVTAVVNLSGLVIIRILAQISIFLGLCVNLSVSLAAIINISVALLPNIKACVSLSINLVSELSLLIQGPSQANQAISSGGKCCVTLADATCDAAVSGIKGVAIGATVLISLQGLLSIVSAILKILTLLVFVSLNVNLKACILVMLQIGVRIGETCRKVCSRTTGSASPIVVAVVQVVAVLKIGLQVFVAVN